MCLKKASATHVLRMVRILQLGSVRVRCVLLVTNVKVTAYAMIKHTPAAYFTA